MKIWLNILISLGLLNSCSTGNHSTNQVTHPDLLKSRRPTSEKTFTRAGLDGWLSPENNSQLWGQYCLGDPTDPAIIPQPNYENYFIKTWVVPKLLQVGEKSFYLSSDVLKVYGLRDPNTQNKKMLSPVYREKIPQGLSLTHNAFLVYLCGEFRDRATLIEEKLRWLARLHKLPMTEQQADIDVRVSPFSQLSAKKYFDYLSLSTAVFNNRKQLTQATSVDLGDGHKIDPATPAFTVCDVKFMMSQYIAKNKSYDANFETDLLGWSQQIAPDGQPHCQQEDVDYVYDFRGDSNFKPNSPESNAMLWAGDTMAKVCATPVTTKDPAVVSDEDCRHYFSHPFEERWGKARQGLMSWLYYPDQYEGKFGYTKSLVVLYPNDPKAKDKNSPLPYGFQLSNGTVLSEYSAQMLSAQAKDPDLLKRGDLGFNTVFELNGVPGNTWKAYNRIRQLVDRHTDWYQSGYDDQRGKQMTQAYSPFVASSYELSKSDAFIACGYTIQCYPGSDTRRQWMFVFKIKKDHWYRTQDVGAGKPVDFSKMWLDETSFGITPLADAENAFDRLGTAVEGEYEDIMYVHNIHGSSGGNKIEEDGLPFDNPYEAAKSAGPLLTSANNYTKTIKTKSYEINKADMARSVSLSFARPKIVDQALTGKALETRLTDLFNQRIRPHMYKTSVTLQPGTKIIPKTNRISVSLALTPAFDMDDLIEILKNSKLEQIEIKKLK